MTSWEYSTWTVEHPIVDQDLKTLSSMGADGWEAYAVTTHHQHQVLFYTHHLKRPTAKPFLVEER